MFDGHYYKRTDARRANLNEAEVDPVAGRCTLHGVLRIDSWFVVESSLKDAYVLRRVLKRHSRSHSVLHRAPEAALGNFSTAGSVSSLQIQALG
jgi:hypothetical protein